MQHKRLSTDTSSVSARRETDAKHVYSASGPTNVCSNTETDTCLLQVQKIKNQKGNGERNVGQRSFSMNLANLFKGVSKDDIA